MTGVQTCALPISDLGITGNNLRFLFNFVFIFITAAFSYRLMRNLSQKGATANAVIEPGKKWVYRILPVFVILPLFSLVTGYMIQDFLITIEQAKYDGGVADEYLVNARYWAAHTNLSLSGGG